MVIDDEVAGVTSWIVFYLFEKTGIWGNGFCFVVLLDPSFR